MNSSLRKDLYFLTLLFSLSAVLFGANLGRFGLLDPDEPFYSLTAKEMLMRGDVSTPVIFGHPQFEKPIFFYWVLYACFKWFGVSEWSARLGPCLAGILTVLITYLWGRALFRRPSTAFACAAILATAAQFIVVSRIVLTDVYLCLFVTAALYAFSLGYFYPRFRRVSWHWLFVFSGLGFLTKGLLGFFLPFMAIGLYALLAGESALISQLPWISGGVLFALTAFPWYALMTAQYGTGFLKHFFIHENIRRFFVAEHGSFDRFYFYPLGLLLGFFPWTFALPFGMVYTFGKARAAAGIYRREFLWLSACFISGFIFFMTAKSKLLSYTFPLFPVIALMIGAWGSAFYRAVGKGGKPAKLFLILASLILGLAPAVLAAGVYVFGAKQGFEFRVPVILFLLTAAPLSWLAFFFLFRKKIKAAFFSVLAMTLVFSLISFGWLLPAADPVFASRDMVKSYEKSSAGSKPGLLLASKLFVRGISYYSGDPNVAVLTDDPDGTFYTKHSIPMISSREDLLKLDAGLFPVYCFFRQKEYDYLKKIAPDDLKVTSLDQGNQRILARLDRLR